MRHVLHIVSVANTYVLLFCVLFLIQRYTIGLLPWFKASPIIFDITPLDLILIVTTILFITKYFKVFSPYKKER
jgi:hypothetical protein